MLNKIKLGYMKSRSKTPNPGLDLEKGEVASSSKKYAFYSNGR